MAQGAKDYVARAAECARLANLTQDGMIQVVLLQQRQTYLRIAAKLGIAISDAISPDAAVNKA